MGAVLHLRGGVTAGGPVEDATPQPVQDGDGNVLLWNGEVFHGLLVPSGSNDTAVVLAALRAALLQTDGLANNDAHIHAYQRSADEAQASRGSCAVLNVLSQIEGPFAFIFYEVCRFVPPVADVRALTICRSRFATLMMARQAATGTLWYGRDRLGRRSLVVQVQYDSATGSHAVCISSVPAPPEPPLTWSDVAAWEEVATTGIFALRFHDVPCSSSSSQSNDALPMLQRASVQHYFWDHVRAHCPGLPASMDCVDSLAFVQCPELNGKDIVPIQNFERKGNVLAPSDDAKLAAPNALVVDDASVLEPVLDMHLQRVPKGLDSSREPRSLSDGSAHRFLTELAASVRRRVTNIAIQRYLVC